MKSGVIEAGIAVRLLFHSDDKLAGVPRGDGKGLAIAGKRIRAILHAFRKRIGNQRDAVLVGQAPHIRARQHGTDGTVRTQEGQGAVKVHQQFGIALAHHRRNSCIRREVAPGAGLQRTLGSLLLVEDLCGSESTKRSIPPRQVEHGRPAPALSFTTTLNMPFSVLARKGFR